MCYRPRVIPTTVLRVIPTTEGRRNLAKNGTGVASAARFFVAARLGIVGVAALLGMTGCAQPLKPIFPPLTPPVCWPPAPMPARVQYVGQLRTSDDLQAPPKPFQLFANLLAGRRPPEKLLGPRAILALPESELVWIADPGGRCLHRFDLRNRTYTKVLRMGAAPLLCPVGMCRGPDDSIYLCDSEAAAIYRVAAADGAWRESLPLPEDVLRPVALHYDAQADELFVVDASAHDIKVLDRDGRLRRTLGRRGQELGEFNFPCDLVKSGELLWVADTGNHRIQALTLAGVAVFTFGQAGDTPGDLAFPKSIAADSDGHLYVVDARFENIQIFDQRGQLLLVIGDEGSGPGEFWLPGGICIDRNDRIWLCDVYNHRVQVFDYLGHPKSPTEESPPPTPYPQSPTSHPELPEDRA
jgi:sugar lactone lactonase YvrE